MSINPNIADGVAPVWVDVTDGAGYTPTERQNATGFFVGSAGNVAFKSTVGGSFITRTFPSGFVLPARVYQIGTSGEGTTATGVMVSITG